jgi:hypothetical protein
MPLPRFLPAICLLIIATAGQAQPRDRGEEREHGPRVIVYEDADYRGASLVLFPGDTLENLSGRTFDGGGRLNDRISSIRVEGGAEIYVYAEAEFRSPVMRLVESVRNLTGRFLPGGTTTSWNDRISALRVEVRRRDEPRVEPEVIIKRAYGDLLGRDPDPAGLKDYRGLIIDQGWNERMVRDNIRRSGEFRGEGADRIIRRAYRDVLEREPDPTGLKDYRRKLLEKDWTEGDVRDALRNSEEYKKLAGRR